MNRQEFTGLPLSVALGIVWDALRNTAHMGITPQEYIDSLPVPEKVRAPKYDHRIGRKGGFQWASETDLESLRYWHKRESESAAEGGQWAAKSEKRAASLARWIAYREQDPASPWSGVRDDAQATAHAPMSKPQIHEYAPRDARPAPSPAANSGGGYSDADYGSEGGDDDSLPF